MGIRSTFAIADCSDEQIIEIAKRFQPFLAGFSNPINFSIVKMDAIACAPCSIALGIIAFLSREVFGFDTVPATIQEHLILQSDSTPEIAEAWNNLLKLPCIALAKIASEVAGLAYAVIYNDSLCSTGTLRFENGHMISGAVFGSGGTDVLFEFSGQRATANIIDSDTGFNYVSTIESQFQQNFGDASILHTLMADQLEELARCQIMNARELIPSPQLAT